MPRSHFFVDSGVYIPPEVLGAHPGVITDTRTFSCRAAHAIALFDLRRLGDGGCHAPARRAGGLLPGSGDGGEGDTYGGMGGGGGTRAPSLLWETPMPGALSCFQAAGSRLFLGR